MPLKMVPNPVAMITGLDIADKDIVMIRLRNVPTGSSVEHWDSLVVLFPELVKLWEIYQGSRLQWLGRK